MVKGCSTQNSWLQEVRSVMRLWWPSFHFARYSEVVVTQLEVSHTCLIQSQLLTRNPPIMHVFCSAYLSVWYILLN
jgi:hypothetical protein